MTARQSRAATGERKREAGRKARRRRRKRRSGKRRSIILSVLFRIN